MNLEQKLLKLQNGKPNSLSIEFNEHWNYYMSPTDAVKEIATDDFVSVEDRQKCIEQNSFWKVQYYPNSPVGFVAVCASSLELALDYLNEDL